MNFDAIKVEPSNEEALGTAVERSLNEVGGSKGIDLLPFKKEDYKLTKLECPTAEEIEIKDETELNIDVSREECFNSNETEVCMQIHSSNGPSSRAFRNYNHDKTSSGNGGQCKSFTFGSKSKLRHTKNDNPDGPLKCADCEYTCLSKRNLRYHMLSHQEEPSFVCTLCNYRTFTMYRLNKHLKIHSTEKPFKCKFCDYRCIAKTYLKKHLTIHEDVYPYECYHCNYKAKWRRSLRNHLKMHASKKPGGCELGQCKSSKKCTTNNNPDGAFKCADCGYTCLTKNTLRSHIRSHQGGPSFSCPHCNYKTFVKGKLNGHLKIHSTEKPFKCKFCDYSSAIKTYLKKHLAIHDVHHYECYHCKFKTKWKTDIVVHLKRHTGIKPVSCELCNYKCIDKIALRKHMRTHDNSHFRCYHCKYKTRRKGNLLVHLKNHKKANLLSVPSEAVDFQSKLFNTTQEC